MIGPPEIDQPKSQRCGINPGQGAYPGNSYSFSSSASWGKGGPRSSACGARPPWGPVRGVEADNERTDPRRRAIFDLRPRRRFELEPLQFALASVPPPCIGAHVFGKLALVLRKVGALDSEFVLGQLEELADQRFGQPRAGPRAVVDVIPKPRFVNRVRAHVDRALGGAHPGEMAVIAAEQAQPTNKSHVCGSSRRSSFVRVWMNSLTISNVPAAPARDWWGRACSFATTVPRKASAKRRAVATHRFQDRES